MNFAAPLLLMVLLTLGVSINLFVQRIPWMVREKINPNQMRNRGDNSTLDRPRGERNTSDNLQNLFELPVLFYALCLLNITMDQTTSVSIFFAYLFVIARIAHSFIHCTYNKVMHRFYSFLASSIALILLALSTTVTLLF